MKGKRALYGIRRQGREEYYWIPDSEKTSLYVPLWMGEQRWKSLSLVARANVEFKALKELRRLLDSALECLGVNNAQISGGSDEARASKATGSLSTKTIVEQSDTAGGKGGDSISIGRSTGQFVERKEKAKK